MVIQRLSHHIVRHLFSDYAGENGIGKEHHGNRVAHMHQLQNIVDVADKIMLLKNQLHKLASGCRIYQ